MGWQNVNWLEVQNQEYETALNDRVREVYQAAHYTLKKALCARQSWYGEAMATAKEESDADAAAMHLMYAENRREEQQQSLATMALSLLAGSNKSFLDQVKEMFDAKHPKDPHGYKGGSQLQRQVAEYNARFGLNLRNHSRICDST
jgi:hypothetical protein